MRRRIGYAILSGIVACVGAGCSRNATDYLAKGNAQFAARQYDDAALEYRKAIQKDPKFGEAFYRLGLTQLEQRKGLEAYDTLSRAVQLMPGNVPATAKLADVSFALYVARPEHPAVFYQVAERLTDQLLAKDADSFDGLRLKGSLRLLDHRPQEAIVLLEKANRIQPMRPELIQSLVQALFQDNRGEEAERLATQLIDANKTFGSIYDVLYRQYISTNRLADAENILKTKCANDPKNVLALLQLAQHYSAVRRQGDMDSILERVLRNTRDFPDGRLQVGDFLAGIGQADRAYQTFDEGSQAIPGKRLTYLRRMTDILLAQGKRDQAAQVLAQVLKETPNDEDARRIRATLRLEPGTPDELAKALTELRALAASRPDDARLNLLMGQVRLAQGDTDGAVNEFQQLIRMHPDDVPSRLALASIGLSRQKPDEALRYAEEVLAREPGNERAELLHASAMVAVGRLVEARAELRRLLAASPNSEEIQFQSAMLAMAERKFNEAAPVLQKLSEGSPGDARLAAALTECYSSQGQVDRAIEALNRNLKRAPESAAMRRVLAAAETRARKYDLAAAEYRRLLAGDAGSIELRLQLAEVYRLKGDQANALAELEQARQLAPKDPEPLMSIALLMENAGRYAEAQAHYRRVLEFRPDNPFVLNNIAYLLVESGGDADEALRLVQRALQKLPDHPVLTDTLGWVYLKKGAKAQAVQVLTSVVRREPQNAMYRYHLAVALLEQGNRQQARSEARSALEFSPGPEVEQKVRALLVRIG